MKREEAASTREADIISFVPTEREYWISINIKIEGGRLDVNDY